MKLLYWSVTTICVALVGYILFAGWQYSFGDGLGLHPALVGGLCTVVGLCWGWLTEVYVSAVEVDLCDCASSEPLPLER